MKNNNNKETIWKVIIFILGILITGLGVNILLRSKMGAGAWDTVTYNLSHLFKISLGIASAIINILVLLVVILANKKLKYLLVVIPIVTLALAIDFWDLLIFKDFTIEQIEIKLLFFVIGLIILPLGLGVTLMSKLPAMVFDELTLALMRVFKIKQFFTMRIFIELFAIILASVLGFIGGIRFGAVNFGSFILAFTIGPMISLYLKWFEPIVNPLIGFNEEEIENT